MRISTLSSFDIGTGSLSRQQAELSKLQNQLSSGKKVVSPADDPVAAAQIITITKAAAINDQTTNNRIQARNDLSLQELTLAQIGNALESSRELLISARNPIHDAQSLSYIGKQLEAYYQTIVGLANTTDANGLYIFSGYQGSEQPFKENVDPSKPADYKGDGGQRTIQVGPSRVMEVGVDGTKIFNRFEVPIGEFVSAPKSSTQTTTDTTTTTEDDASLKDTSYLQSITVTDANLAKKIKRLEIECTSKTETIDPENENMVTVTEQFSFTKNGDPAGEPFECTYTYDKTQLPITPPNRKISFEGLDVILSGTTIEGSVSTVQQASSLADQSVFSVFKQAIDALAKLGEASSGEDTKKIDAVLKDLSAQVDYSFNNILSARASVGSRLEELDILDNNAQDRKLQYAQALSSLQDIDYTSAISDFTLLNTILEAAMKSFTQIQGLSLFKVI